LLTEIKLFPQIQYHKTTPIKKKLSQPILVPLSIPLQVPITQPTKTSMAIFSNSNTHYFKIKVLFLSSQQTFILIHKFLTDKYCKENTSMTAEAI